MRYLYSAAYYCLVPLLVVRMLWRSRRMPSYRQRMAERFGLFPARDQLGRPAIWVHAVSMGEVQAALPLLQGLLREHPEQPLVVTTTTPTGSERVRELLGEKVFHVYLPWDLPGAISRFLQRTRPCLLLVMETELWPNMLCLSRTQGCRIALINGRMSEQSARGYARFPRFTSMLLDNLDVAACQTSADGERLLKLGLPAARLAITGSLKFDIQITEEWREQVQQLRQSLSLQQSGTTAARERMVVVVASTHSREESLLLSAFDAIKASLNDCVLVLVPRHPERFEEVYKLCRRTPWVIARRSFTSKLGMDTDILLVDTVGELAMVLGIASVAVIGGSFYGHGGHNPLEAAAWGVPMLSGPDMFNFEDVSQQLESTGALLRLANASELADQMLELLQDEPRRRRMGASALDALERNSGVVDSVMELIEGLMQRS
ncbi:MAG: lipid IV(A) 3-deoxy-D-manno-octulosonic acid transferase [Pseudomonadota bacterium]